MTLKNIVVFLLCFSVLFSSGMRLRKTEGEASGDASTTNHAYPTYEEYVKQFKKKHTEDEFTRRKQLYEERVNAMTKMNTDGQMSWVASVNQFTDMSDEEMKPYYSGLLKSGEHNVDRDGGSLHHREELDIELPEELDYRQTDPKRPVWNLRSFENNPLPPVKNQGACGSCWAYASAGIIEAQIALQTGSKVDISEGEIISCTNNPRQCGGTGGCHGATAPLGLSYVKDHGVALDDSLQDPHNLDLEDRSAAWFGWPPACSSTEEQHSFKTDHPTFVKINDFKIAKKNDLFGIKQLVTQYGPAAVGVDARRWHWYGGGIFTNCPSDDTINTGHAVLLVGWGHDKTREKKFWLVKNSWGQSWGEDGYMRIERFSDEEEQSRCFTDSEPQHGNECAVEYGGRTNVMTCGACGILLHAAVPVGARIVGPEENVVPENEWINDID